MDLQSFIPKAYVRSSIVCFAFWYLFSSWSEMQAGDIRFRIYKSAIQMLLPTHGPELE